MNQRRHIDTEKEVNKRHSKPKRDKKNAAKMDIKIDWRLSNWSRCSQSCGTDGKQVI